MPGRDDLLGLLRRRDAIRAGLLARDLAPPVVTVTRAPAPSDWLVDGDEERPVAEHAAAHAAGRPSEAAVRYGEGVPPERTVDRLLALAELQARTGLLRAACPVPSAPETGPGSWGVEDLTVLALTRIALPDVPWIRPHWSRLGPGIGQVALAFGATDLAVPPGDRADLEVLAAAVGRTVVAR